MHRPGGGRARPQAGTDARGKVRPQLCTGSGVGQTVPCRSGEHRQGWVAGVQVQEPRGTEREGPALPEETIESHTRDT